MGATDEAKRRSANMRRRGARPVAPEERQNVGTEPPAVQGAYADPSQMVPPQQAQGLPQQPPPGIQPNPMAPAPDRAPPRTAGEVNADLEALADGLEKHKKEQAEEEEPPKKNDGGYADDDLEFEEALWGSNDILNNPARRKRIESRCNPLDLEDYIMNGGTKQKVPVVPGKIEPMFRTAGTDEDLSVKRMMFGVKGTDVYIANRFSLMQLALSLYAFNGEPLPDHLDKEGNFDEEKFEKKFARVQKYPTQLAEDLVNNYMWFDERVKEMFNEDLGNG